MVPIVQNNNSSEQPPLILALDTSSRETGLALSVAGRISASVGLDLEQGRSARLWTEIKILLAGSGKEIRDVDMFAVCVGPGGFTGIRVGVAAAKGFAFATGRPIVGVTSLEAHAFAARSSVPVCVMTGAYKGEVYFQLFDIEDEGLPVARSKALAVDSVRVLELVKEIDPLVFAGDAASAELVEKCGVEGIRKWTAGSGNVGGWYVAPPAELLALPIARLAYFRYLRGDVDDPDLLKACYVRPSEAEVKLAMGLLGRKKRR